MIGRGPFGRAASSGRREGASQSRTGWRDRYRAWLQHHNPLKAAHVMSRLREMRAGAENDPRFGTRMTGEGVLARLIAERFRVACERLGLNRERRRDLDCGRFRPPGAEAQRSLF